MFHDRKQKRKANRQREQFNQAKRRRLEKAAPDLLKACKTFQDEDRLLNLAGQIKLYPNEPIINFIRQIFPEIEAAIAKAEPQKGKSLSGGS